MTGKFVYAFVLIPKNMSFFEDMLAHLSGHLNPGAQVICGSMLKHLAKASFELLNRIIGETHTSLAEKKARLIFAAFQRSDIKSPYPLQVPIEGFEKPFINHSNLFSREKLDIGTRFLLEHIPTGSYPVILDLGCGNGIVGIAAKQRHPGSKIIFSDESRMATLSAADNYRNYFAAEAQTKWIHSYENQEPCSVDLVLLNPPFHQGTSISDLVSWQMFKDSLAALKPRGLLRVIGNSSLHYPAVLQKLFGNSTVVAKNPKFTIVDARKR